MNAEQIFAANFRARLTEKSIPHNCTTIAAMLEKSKKATLTDGAVSCWLYGNKLPRWTTVEVLAEWLGCEVSDLLPREFWDLPKGSPYSEKQ